MNNDQGLFLKETLRRKRVLKLIYDYKEIRGKTVLMKIIYLLNYLGAKYLDFRPVKHKYGPYSFVINQDLSILEEEGYINSKMKNGKQTYSPNYDKIKIDYSELEFNFENDRDEDLKEYNVLQFCKILRNTKMIELATSIHYLVIYENRSYIEDVFNEIDIWKGSRFTKDEKLTAWELLFDNRLLPKEIYKANQLIGELQTCQKGRHDCFNYQLVIRRILHYLFPGKLINIKTETPVDGGEKRIDIIAQNNDKNGFFAELCIKHQIKCPYIIIECKNLSSDIKNQEISQIASMFSDSLGNLGLLFCRSIEDPRSLKSKIKSLYLKSSSQKRVVLVIEDKDVIEMILLKCKGNPPDIVLRQKLEKIIFNN